MTLIKFVGHQKIWIFCFNNFFCRTSLLSSRLHKGFCTGLHKLLQWNWWNSFVNKIVGNFMLDDMEIVYLVKWWGSEQKFQYWNDILPSHQHRQTWKVHQARYLWLLRFYYNLDAKMFWKCVSCFIMNQIWLDYLTLRQFFPWEVNVTLPEWQSSSTYTFTKAPTIFPFWKDEKNFTT